MILTELIGNTPMIELQQINPNPKVKLLAKLEGNNPGGSVKDRAAYHMIKRAFENGSLRQGMTLIEPTSGNTGIALAMCARLLGVKMELVMPDNASAERVRTMEAFGATVYLTPAKYSMEGAIDYAKEKLKKGGYLMLDQFSNPDNYDAHVQTTGPEIWRDTHQEVTHFVSAMGTTGTIMGVSKFLKAQRESIQIVGVQPTDGSNIPGIRRWPKEYLPKIFDPSRIDLIEDVSEDDATKMTRRLAAEEGLFCGMSSGGAVVAATRIAQRIEHGTVVVIICDRGDRYLSTNLFQ